LRSGYRSSLLTKFPTFRFNLLLSPGSGPVLDRYIAQSREKSTELSRQIEFGTAPRKRIIGNVAEMGEVKPEPPAGVLASLIARYVRFSECDAAVNVWFYLIVALAVPGVPGFDLDVATSRSGPVVGDDPFVADVNALVQDSLRVFDCKLEAHWPILRSR
jgi:hypothetical protein